MLRCLTPQQILSYFDFLTFTVVLSVEKHRRQCSNSQQGAKHGVAVFGEDHRNHGK